MGKRCCDMRGMLGFLILFLLSKKEMHGQEIAEELKKRKGSRPSPGTIYPALRSLRESNFIKERRDGNFVFYSITRSGRATLREAKEQFCRTFMDIF